MKLTCNREKFSQAFQLASSMAAVREVKPVLMNVLLTVNSGEVILQATDSEAGIRLVVDGCDVIETGSAILPTRKFKSILQELPDEEFTIEVKNDKSIVTGRRGKFNLDTQDPSEFPEVESFKEKDYYTIPGKLFREMVKRTVFATDDGNVRYTLGGVHIEFTGKSVVAVATDGRRMAFQEGVPSGTKGKPGDLTALFPPKTLSLVERSITDDEQEIKVAISSSRAIIEFGNAVISTRLIEGKFPQWRKILPELDEEYRIDIEVGTLLSAVRQAQITTSDAKPGVTCNLADNLIELLSQGDDVGDSRIEVPISYSGKPIRVKLDPKYLVDFLRAIEAEKELAMYIIPDQPVYFHSDDSFTYVLMSMSG
ncbi:MAG: DNA polymerase III subunit beta [Planctomycetaceae bacterium]|jgi:DNA polymerase-3 subunit beta|nr:DNA polymerase III subunit beta [Planctomycetaceae bacterium]